MKEVILILLAEKFSRFFTILATVSGILAFGVCTCYVVQNYYLDGKDMSDRGLRFLKKSSHGVFVTFIISFILAAFLPNSKDLAIALGVGNTIEYVRGNDKIKEIPDKAILVIDKFLDEYIETDNK